MSKDIDYKRESRRLSKYSGKKLAFSVNNLSSSQKNMLMIKNINAFVQDNPLVDICVFIENIIPPCLYCNFAVYHISQAQIYDGTIVSSDYRTFLNTSKTKRPNHIYYMYDIEWKQQYHGEWNYKNEEFKDVIVGVKKATRCENYKEIINAEFGLNDVSVIKDFDIEKLLEII
jgi:hypothetical protein